MSDPEPTSSTEPATSQTPPGPPRRPWWVKVFIVVAILAALFVILSLAGVLPGGPGRHGPGRHMGSGAEAGSIAPQTIDTSVLSY